MLPELSVSCFPMDITLLEFSLLVKHVYLVRFFQMIRDVKSVSSGLCCWGPRSMGSEPRRVLTAHALPLLRLSCLLW